MATEIRTLKDGEVQVLPRTTAKAVSTEDGTTIDIYIDQKIAEIPTPDVSGQINEHNVSKSAHNDIRTALSGKEASGTANSIVTTHNSSESAHQDIRTKIDNLNLGTPVYCQAEQPSDLSIGDFWYQII